jgi:hypothetical protein
VRDHDEANIAKLPELLGRFCAEVEHWPII